MVTFKQILAGLMTAGLILGSLPMMAGDNLAPVEARIDAMKQRIPSDSAVARKEERDAQRFREQQDIEKKNAERKKYEVTRLSYRLYSDLEIPKLLITASTAIAPWLYFKKCSQQKPLEVGKAALMLAGVGILSYATHFLGQWHLKEAEKVDPIFYDDGIRSTIYYKEELKSDGCFLKTLGKLTAAVGVFSFLTTLYRNS